MLEQVDGKRGQGGGDRAAAAADGAADAACLAAGGALCAPAVGGGGQKAMAPLAISQSCQKSRNTSRCSNRSMASEVSDEHRLVFRDFWQDWLIASGAIAFCLIAGRFLAVPPS
jgi:hypothetical protein